MTHAHPAKLHPLTGVPVEPLGFRRDGRPIWPVLGGDGTAPPAQPATAPAAAPPAHQPPPAAAPPAPAPGPPPGYQSPAPTQPAPPPAPGTPPPPTAPAAPAQPAEQGFPANTPWRDMTSEQQVAYWQHQSRKHEQRASAMADYEQLKATAAEYQRIVEANQTEQQRAVAEARRQGASEALAGANNQIVEQWVRSAAHGRLAPESVDALLAGLNRQAFVTDGRVDTDRVWSFVSSLAPAPATVAAVPAVQVVGQPVAPAPAPAPAQPQPLTQGPDFGQGAPTAPLAPALDRGREIAKRRYAQQNTTKPTVLG